MSHDNQSTVISKRLRDTKEILTKEFLCHFFKNKKYILIYNKYNL